MMKQNHAHYDTLTRFLHWGMAGMIVMIVAAVELHELFPKGSDERALFMKIHIQGGLGILFLVWLRILNSLTHSMPSIHPTPAVWQIALAKAMHIALYLAMIALPVLGVLMTHAGDRAVDFFGIGIPPIISADKALAKDLKEAHEVIGNTLVGLIVFHALAAIWHHVVVKDNTLTRMLGKKAP